MGSANRRLLTRLLLICALMFAFAYALVPLYRAWCDLTGFNSTRTPTAPIAAGIDKSRNVTVELVGHVHPGLAWTLEPETARITVHPGEPALVVFRVVNRGRTAAAGRAVPSYGPALAVNHLRKIECFCFSRQALAAGETQRLPVQFILSPDLPADVTTVTLAYTLFPLNESGRITKRT